MNAADLATRLTRARQTGSGRWVARCPAHADKNPSLSVRELEDGRVLLHCFAGCAVQEIVTALGLTLADLFPSNVASYEVHQTRGFHPLDVLECMRHEFTVVLVCARMMQKGDPLTAADCERLSVAVGRISMAVELAHD